MEKLKEHSKRLLDREVAVVLGGDFNVVPDDDDVHDPLAWQNDALCQIETRKKYRELINLGFSDAFRAFNDTPGRYTFWDYQGGAWPKDHGVRIDHFLLSTTCIRYLLWLQYRYLSQRKKQSFRSYPYFN